MTYTRYTKSNGSIRLVIDRMNLVICAICLVLMLVLAFVGGYLAGFNSRAVSRATLVASAPRQPEVRSTVLDEREPVDTPSVPEEQQPVDTSSVLDEREPVDTSPVLPFDQETTPQASLATPSLFDLYWSLASAEKIETVRPEVDEEPPFEEPPDEEQEAGRTQQDLVQRGEQDRPPEPVEQPKAPDRVSEEERAAPGRYTVQVGAYSNKDNADRMLARVQARGYKAEQVYTWYEQGNPVYCVWIDHYENFSSAQAEAALYREREGEDAVAVRRIIRKVN